MTMPNNTGPMDEQVERVAIALHGRCNRGAWEFASPETQAEYREDAAAAIEAMRPASVIDEGLEQLAETEVAELTAQAATAWGLDADERATLDAAKAYLTAITKQRS